MIQTAILGKALAGLAMGLALVTSTGAHADVLEVGFGSHHWVANSSNNRAGDEAGILSGLSTALYDETSGDLTVPAQAIANSAAAASAVPEIYARKVQELSTRFDLSPSLIEALVWQESRWRPNAVSPVGARGLTQLMPGTAREMGVDPADPLANLEGGARYLRQQLDRFDGNVEKALAAYNAGPGRVIKAGGIPRIRETQNYVTAIFGRLSNHSRR